MSDEQPTPAERPELAQSIPSPVSSSSGTHTAASAVVLIADDEESIAETLAWVVQGLGYTPLVAPNGREALELARTSHPVLLITDWMMPFLDGPGLIRALKRQAVQDGCAPIPTILLSAARVLPSHREEADAFLAKPFDLEELEALLRRFLSPPSPGG